MEGTGDLCHPHSPATESQTLSAGRNSLLVQCLFLLVYPGDRELTTCWTTTLSWWPFLGEISPWVRLYSLTSGPCCTLESPEPASPHVSQAEQTASGRGPSHLVFSRPHFAGLSWPGCPLELVSVLLQAPMRPTPSLPLAPKQVLHQMRQTLDLEPPTPECKSQWLTSQLCSHNEIILNEQQVSSNGAAPK